MAFSGRGNKICDRVQALNTIRKSKSGKLALAMIGGGAIGGRGEGPD